MTGKQPEKSLPCSQGTFSISTRLPAKTLRAILDDAHAMKATGPRRVCRTRSTVRPRRRARHDLRAAFDADAGVLRGGHARARRQRRSCLSPADMQIGRGETIADTARVLSRYVDAIMLSAPARTRKLLELAAHATVPVINGLTNLSHPCQVMADVMTFEEKKGPIDGATVAWLGDANNVATSWVHARRALRLCAEARLSGASSSRRLSCLPGRRARRASVEVGHDPHAAAARRRLRGHRCLGVHGRRRTTKERKSLLKPFQVDRAVMACAKPDAIFMHCLPAHRGDEVDAGGDRRPAIGGVGRGREPAACAEGHPRLVPRRQRRAARSPSGARRQRWRGRRRGQVMASESSSQERIELVIPADDLILPFQAEQADVGRPPGQARPAVDTILSRHDYPEPVSQLLGEAVALTALLGAALKFEGKFILQASTDGPVDLLVADYQVPGGLRGYARFSPSASAAGAATRDRRVARPGPSRHDHRPRIRTPSAIRAWCRSKARA